MKKLTLSLVCGFIILFSLVSGKTFAQNAYTKICLEAINYEKEGKLDEAVNKYTEAINLKPDDWTGYNYRAKVNFHRGLYDDAIADISRAISLSPQSLSAYAVRANCYEAKGLYDKAIIDYGVALSKTNKIDVDIYLTYYQRGRTYFLNKQYQEAIDDFSQSISMAQKLKEQTTDIYKLRAQSYLELKKYKEAVTDFESYLSSNPNDVEAILLQGKALLKNGQQEQANINADKLLKLDPSKEILFSDKRKLDIYDLDLRREKAKQLLKDADILISERASIPSKTLANIKLTDAFKYLDTAWLCSPGLTKEDRNLRDTIREKFFIVYPLLKTKPDISEQVRRYVVQATSATHDKKYDTAVNLWTTTLDISPYLPIAYYNRALLYEMKGLFRYSISDLGKYIKLAPDASDARNSKDKIYELEAKVSGTPGSAQSYHPGAINQIQSTGYSPGNFTFAFSAGGGIGLQFSKNPGLANLWTSLTNGATPDYNYDDKMPLLYSGNLEMVVKPVRRIGIGAFGNWTGGIGCRTKVQETKYMLNMGSGQFGGLIRYYMILNNGFERPDFYVQYAYGQTRLSGDYAIATMDGIIYNYSYLKEFKGTGPYNSLGLGMGGKIGKHGYLTMSLDYLSSNVEDFTSLVVTNKGNTRDEGTEGSVKGVNATYKGLQIRFLFGFCL